MSHYYRTLINKSASETFFLDAFPNKTLVFSLRKLMNCSVPCIRVRRDNDHDELDIGYDVNGDLDIASLLLFVGSNNGYLVIWYNQSGTNHATITTKAQQPQIVAAGVLRTENGKPTIYHTSANWLQYLNPITNGAFSKYEVIRFRDNAYQGTGGFGSVNINPATGLPWCYMSLRGGTNYFGYNKYNFAGQSDTVYAHPTAFGMTFKVASWHQDDSYIFGGSHSSTSDNNSTATPISTDNGYGSFYYNYTNRSWNGSGSNVNISEFILFDADQRADDTAIINEIKAYYGIS